MFKIYTDGAASNNGKDNSIGGWAFVIIDENSNIIKEDYGKEELSTNQRMELTAAIKACQYIEKEKNLFSKVIVYSDSAYLINCYKQNWYKNWERNCWKNSKKELVANKDLWKQIIPFFNSINFTFEKVKGHNGDYYNEYVDNLAVKARKED